MYACAHTDVGLLLAGLQATMLGNLWTLYALHAPHPALQDGLQQAPRVTGCLLRVPTHEASICMMCHQGVLIRG